MPLRDDWTSASELISQLDKALTGHPASFEILLVDDGSVEKGDPAAFSGPYWAVGRIRVLRLRRNLGHQRAIAVGLAYLEGNVPCDAVLVMDSDGEDTPDGVLQLLRAFTENQGAKVVFAERSRRSESLSFRCFYKCYKVTHRCLTGVSVRVGNFSILPAASLGTLVVVSETWNHYAAAVFRSKLPFTMVPIPRGHRIAGASQMNFVGLVSHGLSAISVFGDVVGVRLLITSIAASIVAGIGILIVVGERFFTDRAIPGWATSAAGALAIMIIQLISIAASFTFFVLSSRTNFGFIPCRDYSLFVAGTTDFYPHD
jgi:glycosyltransferase involved in cell wall biosynthesis